MLNENQRKLVSEVCQRVPGNERDMLYHVSFDHPTEGKVFGQADTFDDDAFAQAKEGRIIVRHSVYRYSRGPYAVKAEKITPHKMGYSREYAAEDVAKSVGFMFWGESPHDDYESMEELAHAIRFERNTDEEKVQVNDMFRIGIADGCAVYVVASISGNRCNVEWRGLAADDYYDHHFGGGGTYAVSSVARYVLAEKGTRKLFHRNQEQGVDKPKAFEKLLAEYEKNHGFPCPVTL